MYRILGLILLLAVQQAASLSWKKLKPAPTGIGECSACSSGGKIFVGGDAASNRGAMFIYNIGSNSWSTGASRRFASDHHAYVQKGSTCYFLGGFGSAARKFQAYNMKKNKWSTLADIPFASGSGSSCLIGNDLYHFGGITGRTTVSTCAHYNFKSKKWDTNCARMPQGVNHAAYATYKGACYVFGGRKGGNTVGPGFNYAQKYSPKSNKWTTLRALPFPRGGMGKAIPYNGKIYVFAGESNVGGATVTGQGVLDRVDIYNVGSNTWSSQLGGMGTPRHGICPVRVGGKVYLPTGGVRKGFSRSNIIDVANL